MAAIIIHIAQEVKEVNEVAKKPTSDVALTGGQKFQVQLMNELEKSADLMGQEFTPYGKKCVINSIAGLVSYCKQQGISLYDIDPIIMRLSLQNVGYVELNYAAIPSELYFDLRKVKTKVKGEDGKEEEKETYVATIKPQGAGNEKLVRKYGVGLKPDTGLHPALLIREGDKFVLPTYNGLTVTPPIYEPKIENANNKVVAVLYVAEKIDGSVEYLIATREGIKPNIIAQIRQNTLYNFKVEKSNSKGVKYQTTDYEKRDAFYKEMEEAFQKMTVDQILDDPKWSEFINPTYTSGGSKESMIIRKMKNNALKNYPKEYDNAYMRDAVESMFEDRDETVMEKAPINRKKEDVVEMVERESEEKPSDENAPQNFKVNDEGVVEYDVTTKEPETKEESEVKEEPKDDPKEESEGNDYDSLI